MCSFKMNFTFLNFSLSIYPELCLGNATISEVCL